jgi:transcription elongation factor GreA-like protein
MQSSNQSQSIISCFLSCIYLLSRSSKRKPNILTLVSLFGGDLYPAALMLFDKEVAHV